jgi:hypothetical protein
MFKFPCGKNRVQKSPSLGLAEEVSILLEKRAKYRRQESIYHIDDIVIYDEGIDVNIAIVYENNCFIFKTDCYEKFDIDKFIEEMCSKVYKLQIIDLMQKEWYHDKITKTAITKFHMVLLEKYL